MVRGRCIHRQGQIGVKFAEKKPRAGLRVQKIGVFTHPS